MPRPRALSAVSAVTVVAARDGRVARGRRKGRPAHARRDLRIVPIPDAGSAQTGDRHDRFCATRRRGDVRRCRRAGRRGDARRCRGGTSAVAAHLLPDPIDRNGPVCGAGGRRRAAAADVDRRRLHVPDPAAHRPPDAAPDPGSLVSERQAAGHDGRRRRPPGPGRRVLDVGQRPQPSPPDDRPARASAAPARVLPRWAVAAALPARPRRPLRDAVCDSPRRTSDEDQQPGGGDLLLLRIAGQLVSRRP